MSERECDRCKGWPCVCHYVEKIGVDDSPFGQLARSRTRAARQEPHPPLRSCSCVECYRVRYSTWEVTS